jgi:hypothetical protein
MIEVVTCVSRNSKGLSGGDLVFVRESAEDLFPADLVLGEVDFRWPGAGLSRCELAEGTVRPGGVVVPEVFGQHLPQMVSLTISSRPRSSRRSVPMILSQMASDHAVNCA